MTVTRQNLLMVEQQLAEQQHRASRLAIKRWQWAIRSVRHNVAIEKWAAERARDAELAIKQARDAELAIKQARDAALAIKREAYHKAETAKNMQESDERRRMRALINARKAEAARAAWWTSSTTLPGISHAVGKQAEEQLSTSDVATKSCKKTIALNKRKEDYQKKREEAKAKMQKEEAEQAERARCLEVASMLGPGGGDERVQGPPRFAARRRARAQQ